MINLIVPDMQAMWAQIECKVRVEAEPAITPWGTIKMVILDPDGYRLGFVEDPQR